MNTSTVSKLLDVSPSTIKRWIKELQLDMERNDLGHYLFSEEDIELLKQIQEKLCSGMVLQDIVITNEKVRKGTVKDHINESGLEKLEVQVSELEKRLDTKADDVASYQILQHRREIEELQQEVKLLNARLEALEKNQEEKKKSRPADLLVFDQSKAMPKTKKKKLLSMLFGF
ncbi:MerR family transcriptional regulator [Peribacillus cavernae]|uniref:Chromosome-anchoring protein RacA n=1 Tax=Peribacillus cavernae TaxID=1674310 RepID=A0A3S0VSU8_9BACI|nr:MerR family transcriptional regulator [Peribacillus cavernae]MDQ0220302.1 chromosome-anchoring protein RacA [Peribacillus cavernae]RUQ31960.1 MerR family transcriptional regulator [Peribacillus cavernae]